MSEKRSFYYIRLFDIVSIILSYLLATVIRYRSLSGYHDFAAHWIMLPVMITAYIIITIVTQHHKRPVLEETCRIILLNLFLACSGISILFFLHKSEMISRLVLFLFTMIDFLFMMVVRNIMRIRSEKSRGLSSCVVIADSEDHLRSALHTMEFIRKNYRIVNKIVLNDPEHAFDDLAKNEIILHEFDYVFLCLPSYERKKLLEIIHFFNQMGVTVIERLPEEMTSDYFCTLIRAGKYPLIYYQTHRIPAGMMMIKRLTDIVGGIVGILLTGLLSIVLIPLIKLDSPGPAFFGQTRIGKNGRRFKMYKFRSMYTDAEERKKELESQNKINGLMFKMDNDPRVTRVGKFIRRTSLDEFPQFWNVLKGEMSLVGTRPPTVDEFEKYNEHYRRRLSVTPGITGVWQVSGRSDIVDFDEVVAMDLDYIDNWSLWLDVKILLQTVVEIFSRKGAR